MSDGLDPALILLSQLREGMMKYFQIPNEVERRAFFHKIINPLLKELLKHGYDFATAMRATGIVGIEEGALFATGEAASLLGARMAFAETAASTALRVGNVLLLVLSTATPASAEGMNNTQNRFAYQQYVSRRLSLIQRRLAQGARNVDVLIPLPPGEWWRAVERGEQL